MLWRDRCNRRLWPSKLRPFGTLYTMAIKRKSPEPEAPPAAAAAAAPDVAFPRGGGSILTPLEEKKLQAKAKAEVERELAFGGGTKSKRAKKGDPKGDDEVWAAASLATSMLCCRDWQFSVWLFNSSYYNALDGPRASPVHFSGRSHAGCCAAKCSQAGLSPAVPNPHACIDILVSSPVLILSWLLCRIPSSSPSRQPASCPSLSSSFASQYALSLKSPTPVSSTCSY